MSGELVLVTGGSGFLGAHCIIALQDAGYRVRTTVRSLNRASQVREMLAVGGADGESVEFCAAELSSDDGWAEAVAGCDFVLHVASPFPTVQPKDESELIVPARDGALRVLRAARDAGVKRVVMTSSFAAIGYGTKALDRPYTEGDWTDPAANVSPYIKSKTIAERAAWDFVDREGNGMELSVVNPLGIVGPVLGTQLSSSIEIVKQLMLGEVPGVPKVYFGVVDVRDVADLHLRAMINPAAAGQRFIAVAGDSVSIPQMAEVLRTRLGSVAAKVTKRVLPDIAVRAFSLINPSLKEVVSRLGEVRNASNTKAVSLLGWHPRSSEDAVVATAESLVRVGIVNP